MPGAGRVEMQGEMLGEAQHRGIWVRSVVERIALGGSSKGAQSGRELLVASLVGPLVGCRGFGRRRFGRRRFGIALGAVRGLIRLVVGVGIVVIVHSPASMTANPATLQFLISPHAIARWI